MATGEVDAAALRCLSYGLYIVTARSGERLNGQIVNTAFQVAATPPTIAVSINKENLTHQFISESGVMGICVLDETTPMTLIGTFGFRSGRDIDKFERVEYTLGQTGVPLVTEHVLSVIEARVTKTIDVGTHTLFIGEIVSCQVIPSEAKALTYDYYHKDLKGKTPKNAPSYVGPDTNIEKEDVERNAKPMKRYVCTVCGYLYDPKMGDPDNGIKPGTAFEKLPPNWTCPVCGVDKDAFEPEE